MFIINVAVNFTSLLVNDILIKIYSLETSSGSPVNRNVSIFSFRWRLYYLVSFMLSKNVSIRCSTWRKFVRDTVRALWFFPWIMYVLRVREYVHRLIVCRCPPIALLVNDLIPHNIAFALWLCLEDEEVNDPHYAAG